MISFFENWVRRCGLIERGKSIKKKKFNGRKNKSTGIQEYMCDRQDQYMFYNLMYVIYEVYQSILILHLFNYMIFNINKSTGINKFFKNKYKITSL